MKLLITAAGLVAMSTSFASAQYSPYSRDLPYAERRHAVCQEKARRLFEFERKAERESGRGERFERRRNERIVAELRRELRVTCGGYRFRG